MAEGTAAAKDASSSFTRRMRDETRGIHTVSDALVNLKLGATLSDEKVWAEGILVFYEVFRFLEEAINRHKDSLLGEFCVDGVMGRTAAWEADLAHYFGADWKAGYVARPEVADYLTRLQALEMEDPYLLVAYIYHLYMGLLSGGQILKAKKKLSLKSDRDEAIATFPGGKTLRALKEEIRAAANHVAENLDEETADRIVAEGVRVFELNNRLIRSVRGVNDVLLWRVAVSLFLFFAFLAVVTKLLW